MINRAHGSALTRQAELLDLSRSGLYYEPAPVPAHELAMMRRIDALHLDYPFAGSHMLRDMVRAEGVPIGRDLVITLMHRMAIQACPHASANEVKESRSYDSAYGRGCL